MCPHTTIYVSSYYYSVLILPHVCPHTTMYVCPHTTTCVSSYYYVAYLTLPHLTPYTSTCVLSLVHMCPQTSTCALSCVLRLVYTWVLTLFYTCVGTGRATSPARYMCVCACARPAHTTCVLTLVHMCADPSTHVWAQVARRDEPRAIARAGAQITGTKVPALLWYKSANTDT